jgi:hypothetical protein
VLCDRIVAIKAICLDRAASCVLASRLSITVSVLCCAVLCCGVALRQGQEVKDVAKSKHSQALADVKRLERQKGELLTVLKKQARLIDVLRRQRAQLEAAQLLSFTEEEFMKTLDVRAG